MDWRDKKENHARNCKDIKVKVRKTKKCFIAAKIPNMVEKFCIEELSTEVWDIVSWTKNSENSLDFI